MPNTTAFPWTQGKWRTKEEGNWKNLQILDLILKILVPASLLVCLVISIKFGSFNGYLQLMSRQSFATPLMALGAGFTLAYLAFQVVRTVLWWRYKPYPLARPPAPGHRHRPRLQRRGHGGKRPLFRGRLRLPRGPPGDHLH